MVTNREKIVTLKEVTFNSSKLLTQITANILKLDE
jgi:hypothetical protein